MRMPVQKQRFLVRGNFVYDNINHTNVLNVAVWSDYTTLLAIEDLPTNAGTYLKHYAAEQAFIQDDGDIQVHTRLLQRVDKAWALLRKDEMQAVSANALESPYAMRLRMGPGSHSPRAEFLGGGNLR
jgi:hypothetical protein